ETRAHHQNDKLQIELKFARRYHPNGTLATNKWLYRHFVGNITYPLIVYLSEALDSNKAILAILERYKHKCEWFQRGTLDKLWQSDSSKGEELLKLHLFDYLHDSGLQFAIDPFSPTGKADLVAEGFAADAKLIREGGKGQRTIICGFHQVYK